VGAAVGLGNIWRFPTLAGESGGGAFVIVYIACVFLLGLPLVLSEIFIGRVGQTDAIGSIRRVAAQSQASPGWSVFGAVGALAAFLIVAFYSVVAGWVLYYVGVMGSDLAQAIMAGDPFPRRAGGGKPRTDPAAAGRHVRQSRSAPGSAFPVHGADALQSLRAASVRASRRPPPTLCRCSSSCLSGW
jgi:hypothetical protein